MKPSTIAEIRKLVVALVGAAAEALNAGLVHGSAAHWAAIAVAVATAVGVFVTPNVPAQKAVSPPSAPPGVPPVSAAP